LGLRAGLVVGVFFARGFLEADVERLVDCTTGSLSTCIFVVEGDKTSGIRGRFINSNRQANFYLAVNQMIPPWLLALIVLVFVAGIGANIVYSSKLEEFNTISNRKDIPPPLAKVNSAPADRDNQKYSMNPYGLFKRTKVGMAAEAFEDKSSTLSELLAKIKLNETSDYGISHSGIPGISGIPASRSNEPLVEEVSVTSGTDKQLIKAEVASEKGTMADEIRSNEPKVASVREHLRVEDQEKHENPHAVEYKMQ